MRDLNASANQINDDLKKIAGWAHQWRMSFDPDTSKQAQEVMFSRKRNKPHHPDVIFNRNPVKTALTKKIWGCFVTENLILMNI